MIVFSPDFALFIKLYMKTLNFEVNSFLFSCCLTINVDSHIADITFEDSFSQFIIESLYTIVDGNFLLHVQFKVLSHGTH